jgi:hypothetical protein
MKKHYMQKGQGIITSKDGMEIATWKGYRIERYNGRNRTRTDRGSVFFKTSPNGKLVFLYK